MNIKDLHIKKKEVMLCIRTTKEIKKFLDENNISPKKLFNKVAEEMIEKENHVQRNIIKSEEKDKGYKPPKDFRKKE